MAEVGQPRSIDLLGLLVANGLIGEADAERLRREATASGRAEIVLIHEAGLVGDDQVMQILLDHVGLSTVDPSEETAVDLEALRWLPQELAEAHLVLPIRIEQRGAERFLVLAMADPLNAISVQTVEQTSGIVVDPVLAAAGPLLLAIESLYPRVVTRLIPRQESPKRSSFGTAVTTTMHVEPETTPAFRIEDEASPALMVQALVNVLTSKGVIDRDEYIGELKRLLKEEAGE